MGHARDRQYAARHGDDLARLLAAYPFAWLVSPGGDDAAFTPLPLRAEFDAAGRLHALRGHVARRNPHVARLKRDPAALALFMGPEAYVSSSWLEDRTRAPTWNYAAAAVELRVHVREDAPGIAAELDALVAAMEAGRTDAWQVREMGERFARLAGGVSALQGDVVAVHATFKLGQDERPQDFAQMLAGLRHGGHDALVAWMQRYAPEAGAPTDSAGPALAP